jgi:hypothetical protein
MVSAVVDATIVAADVAARGGGGAAVAAHDDSRAIVTEVAFTGLRAFIS